MGSAPERAERPPSPDAERVSAGGRPRRRGRAIAVLVVLALGGIGVAVTWPRTEPSIASAKENPPVAVDPNAAAEPCTSDDLKISLAADRLTVTPGVPVEFTVSLRNESEVQCLVDGPRRSVAVTVYQGEVGEPTAERAWSSADCADPEEERLLLLGPGDVDVTSSRWSDSRSVPGCKPGQPDLSAGEYTAQVTLADVEGLSSDVVRLTYTIPEPSRSPSPSGSPSGDGDEAGDGDGDGSPDADKDASPDASTSPEADKDVQPDSNADSENADSEK